MLELKQPQAVDNRRKQADWNYGYRLFEAGQSKSYCTNIDQVRGWNAACDACGYAEGSAYLVGQGAQL